MKANPNPKHILLFDGTSYYVEENNPVNWEDDEHIEQIETSDDLDKLQDICDKYNLHN